MRANFASVLMVRGAQLLCLLEPAARPPDVGDLVVIAAPEGLVVGVVHALRRRREDEAGLFEVQLLGELPAAAQPGFRRGVRRLPGLGAPVRPASMEEERQVHRLEDVAVIDIGHIRGRPAVPARLMVDALLGKHFAIVGSTGSGKSTVLARILHELLACCPAAHVLLVDPHGEYGRAFGARARVLDVTSLTLPHWLLAFDELARVVLGEGAEQARAERIALHDALLAARRRGAALMPERRIGVDTPVPYPFSALGEWLEEARGSLERAHERSVLGRLVQRLELARQNPRYAFLFRDLVAQDSLGSLLARLFAFEPGGPAITILDTSAMAAEIAEVVVAALARLAFEIGLWSEPECRRPLLFACEEAHRYVPADHAPGFPACRRAIERLAREGRKYGTALALVSQRPADLSPAALSQCGTILALRTGNDVDRRYIERALPDGCGHLVEALPALATGEALVTGEGTPVPAIVAVRDLEDGCRPQSRTPSFAEAWRHPCGDIAHLEAVVRRWRRGGA